MKTIAMRCVAISALSLSVAWCALGELTARAETRVKLHLDWIVNGYHAPFYAAVDRGLYKAAGLDVTIEPGRGSFDAIRSVAAKNAEFGFADAATVIKSAAEGIPTVVVAVYLQKSPKGVVSFASKNIKRPKDLEGKTIGVVPEDASAKTFAAFLNKNGVDPAKVKIVNYTYATHTASLLTGQVDGATEYIIGAFIAAKNAGRGPVSWMSYDDFGVRSYSNGIIVHPDFRKSQPEVVRAFVKASIKGLEWATSHVDAAVDIVAKHAQADKPTLKEQFVLAIPLMSNEDTKKNGLGHMRQDLMEQTQELMVKYGGQPKPVPLDQVYTNEFLK